MKVGLLYIYKVCVFTYMLYLKLTLWPNELLNA